MAMVAVEGRVHVGIHRDGCRSRDVTVGPGQKPTRSHPSAWVSSFRRDTNADCRIASLFFLFFENFEIGLTGFVLMFFVENPNGYGSADVSLPSSMAASTLWKQRYENGSTSS